MSEQHPSISALGSHFDDRVTIAALAQRYFEEEGRPEGKSMEHWLRAERELHPAPACQPTRSEAPPENPEARSVEEAMHLGQ